MLATVPTIPSSSISQRLTALGPVRHPLDLGLEEVGQPLGLAGDGHPLGQAEHPSGPVR